MANDKEQAEQGKTTVPPETLYEREREAPAIRAMRPAFVREDKRHLGMSCYLTKG